MDKITILEEVPTKLLLIAYIRYETEIDEGEFMDTPIWKVKEEVERRLDLLDKILLEPRPDEIN